MLSLAHKSNNAMSCTLAKHNRRIKTLRTELAAVSYTHLRAHETR